MKRPMGRRLRARQGDRVYLWVPSTGATLAAGLVDMNGTALGLVRRTSVHREPCWVVRPPLTITFRTAGESPQGKLLPAGHRRRLPAVPEAWLQRRAPSWGPAEISYLREHYGTAPTAAIAAHLVRGLAAVRTKVQELQLRCRTVWTPELDEILTLMFPDTAAGEVGALIGASEAAVRLRASQLGVKKAPGFAAEHARRTTLARSRFTQEIAEIIELMYPDTLSESIAQFIGMPVERVQAFANAHGWKKTPAFVRDTARARMGADHPMRRYQFPKGHVPRNKGVKGYDSGGRSHETRFKKGNRPQTWKPIGSERVCDGFVQVKMTDSGYPPRDWVPKHVVLWEKANGRKVPPGHVVAFRDGNRRNFDDTNFELITRQELMRRNSYHTNLPPELRKLVQLRGVMNRMINKRQRQLAEGQPS